ncbi:PREDICTED: pentatricopeptide repeat-containing protein At4g36680, mitochondrial-like [Nelumbo nucifera]|uniref:Pentatricopeptide repeat-containing protein At4g36680, mitochondrial-like n=1 Tax=Nelumbo nucifera TaxID=4432 RepID=A0A1U8BC05_NELNU|nr:PREDICTED: pentatricopeptide repeat-containing protein At4g36680, mitochondrial-like [Nelumbo nucifera]
MSSLSSIRHVRRFSTSSAISISAAKARLRSEHDPDKALAIYSSVSDRYSSPVSSRYAQDLTVKRLAKSRRFSDIEKLIESHKKDPKITQEPFLSTLIRSYGRAGMFDHALQTFNQMNALGTPRSAISFNALLSACNQSKKFDQVPKLFSEISQKYGISPDKISYGILIKSLCESDLPESTFKILKEMKEKDVEVTAVTYTTILDALYKKGKTEEAEQIWDEMVAKGCSPDTTAYNVRIMHVHHGKPEAVLALIGEMSSAGLKPDTISYNYLLTCYCKNDMLEDAKKVYEGLEGNGCLPNAATFRTYIYYLCRNGDFGRGFEVYEDSVRRDKIPDFGTMKPLVEGLVKNSKLKEAKRLIKTVKKKFPPNFLNAWKKLEMGLDLGGNEESATEKASST